MSKDKEIASYNVIDLAREGKPDVRLTTTHPITSEYLQEVMTHIRLVEGGSAPHKQFRR